ncbi:MAG TPA: transglutaminase family protein [Nevskiaceae bacterium]|nr:transglutaminase family protein [Nevskiaceae bacterium]
MTESLSEFLAPTLHVDADHPGVRAFAAANGGDIADPRERAVALYYAVRDQFRYDPYRVDLRTEGMRASHVLASGTGWCVTKAALLAAACRATGIPARIGYADVRNHLSTERMRAFMKTDVYYWHGYTSIHLDGKWVKATPAFNKALCERFRLKPLEFDGREDSIYHAFDQVGNRHMEYLRFRGELADVPLEEMKADFARYYPDVSMIGGDFDQDVAAET